MPSEPSPSVSAVPVTIANAACVECAHWRRYEPREVPSEPETHGRIFGIRYARDDFMVSIDRYIRSEAISHNQSGRCYRYPKTVETHEKHWCAEFSRGEQP